MLYNRDYAEFCQYKQRGEMMAKETVQAVRNAEMSAAKMEKEALGKKETIIAEAHKKAKELSDFMVKEAQAKADKDIKEALHKSNIILEKAKEEAEKEVGLLIEMAKTKEDAAIDLVISNVI